MPSSRTKRRFDKRRDGLRVNAYKQPIKWQVDYDYVQQLIEAACSANTDPTRRLEAIEALEFLSQFTLEYYKKSNLKDRDALHGKRLRKAIYNALNATSRDLLSLKPTFVTTELPDIPGQNPEDALIDYLDSKKSDKFGAKSKKGGDK